METHQTFGERLDGHKTYLTAIGFAFLAAYKIWGRHWEDGIEMALVATATASLRHAIARKAVQPKESLFLEDHD
jgi:hypothetical protein